MNLGASRDTDQTRNQGRRYEDESEDESMNLGSQSGASQSRRYEDESENENMRFNQRDSAFDDTNEDQYNRDERNLSTDRDL